MNRATRRINKLSAPNRFSRGGEIRRLMRKLELEGHPRLQMFLLVSLTGLAGLLASFIMLQAGIGAMHLRYPLAVGCAWLAFLFLLWLWLRTQAEDWVDVPADFSLPSGGADTPGHGDDVELPPLGAGGEFGGGGASAGFSVDDTLPAPDMAAVDLPGVKAVGEAVGDVVGGADEGAIPLAVALLIAALVAVLLFASLYVVYLAPALFAELLVDGVLSASLYRRMRGLQSRHWLESAVRRSFLPFSVTAVGLAVIAYALHGFAPEAHSLGQVLQHFRGAG